MGTRRSYRMGRGGSPKKAPHNDKKSPHIEKKASKKAPKCKKGLPYSGVRSGSGVTGAIAPVPIFQGRAPLQFLFHLFLVNFDYILQKLD